MPFLSCRRERSIQLYLKMCIRDRHDSSDKRLSSKVETYPLNQSQISIFTEDLLKLTEEKKTDVYKRQRLYR